MSRKTFAKFSTAQLIERFAKHGVDQFNAELHGQIERYNAIYDEMASIASELQSRPGDQRRALTELYSHPNVQVRLAAAKKTLAVTPVEARRVIESIATSRDYPYAGDAGICLELLDDGTFKPI
jgi:hypothetical protein